MRLRVAAVAQLAEELVDEVAAVREDQHAAGARGLDEAERGDGLAGAGRVLEPEALGGVGVLGLLGELLLVLGALGVLLLVPVGERRLGLGAVELGLELGGDVLVVARPRRRRPRRGARAKSSSSSSSSSSCGVVVLVLVVVVLGVLERGSSSSSSGGSSSTPRIAAPASTSTVAVGVPLRRCAAPRRAARSACPRARRPGGRRASCRRRASARPRRARARGPSSSEYSRRQAVEGYVRPSAELGERARRARARRGVPGASATARSSPAWTKGSRVNASARAMSASLGRAIAATGVGSAIEALYVRRGGVAGSVGATRRRSARRDCSCQTTGVTSGKIPSMAYGFARMARLAPLLAAAVRRRLRLAGATPAARRAAQAAAALRGSPAPLAAVHRQASELLAGGVPAFEARLRALRGYPVVVMQWSSWCEGCKADLADFQTISAQLGRRVAFIGDRRRRQRRRRPPGAAPAPGRASPATSTTTARSPSRSRRAGASTRRSPTSTRAAAGRSGGLRRPVPEPRPPARRDQDLHRCLRSASTRSRACARSSRPTARSATPTRATPSPRATRR